jgi:hypothetical protein
MQEARDPLFMQKQAREGRIPWGWVVATAIGIEAALIISAFAWVAIYSLLIHPGEDNAYYQNYAKSASPIVSIVVGFPIWFFTCRWVGRKAGTRAVAMCLWAWLVLFFVDLPLNFFSEDRAYSFTIFAIAHFSRLPAVYFGGRAALKRISESS